MAFAPMEVGFSHGDKSILGMFRLKENDNLFEFSTNKGEFGALDGWPHRVYVSSNPINDSGWRYARVLKTVAYIVTDENEYGDAVVEKWDIKNHRLYEERI